MTQPFVYIIQHLHTGKKYAGVKFAKGCHPDQLLTTYFTSSKVVKKLLLEDPTSFKILNIIPFDTKEDAIEFEEFLLTEVDAAMSNQWLNQAIGKAINPDAVKATCLELYGVENASSCQEVRDKVDKTCMGKFGARTRFEADDFEEIRRNSMLANHGVEYSMQSPVLRDKSKVTMQSKYGVDNPSQIQENRELHSKLMREKNGVEKQCEHCGKMSNVGNYNRWHGNNCKLNPNL